MKRKRTRKGMRVGEMFAVIEHKMDGAPCNVYLCRTCTKAWRLPNPAEGWRIKTLLSHASTHATDNAAARMLASAAPDRAEG